MIVNYGDKDTAFAFAAGTKMDPLYIGQLHMDFIFPGNGNLCWLGIFTKFSSNFSRYFNVLGKRHNEQWCERGIELFIHVFKKVWMVDLYVG